MMDIETTDRLWLKMFLPFIVLLLSADVSAQDKKTLTPADYDRWYHFSNYSLSPDAKWVNYVVKNPRGKDTMVLRRTERPSREIFLGATKGSFSPQSDWFAYLSDRQVRYRSLHTGQGDSIADIDSYFFTKDGKYLVGERKKEKELALLNLETNALQVIRMVQSHALSPDSTHLALVKADEGKRTIQIVTFAKAITANQLAEYNSDVSGLTWNSKGNGIAFFVSAPPQIKDITQRELHYLKIDKRKSKAISDQTTTSLPADLQVPVSRLFFSMDDKQLFFDVRTEATAGIHSEGVQIWSSGAKTLPPPSDKAQSHQYLMCWHLTSNEFVPVNNDRYMVIPTASGKHALEIDNQKYLPFFKHGGLYNDLYCKDLTTGVKKMIAEKVHDQKNHISISPMGTYITWFKDNNWWTYDIGKDSTSCLTCSVRARFENWAHDYPGDKFPNDRPHWAENDQFLLLSDFYDVWLFTPDGKIKKRVTDGSAKKNKFRVHDKTTGDVYREHFVPYVKAGLHLEKGIFLSEVNTNTLEEGMHFFELNETLKPVVYTDDKIRDIKKTGDTYLYTLGDFDKSPEMLIQKGKKSKGVVIQRSNEHQKEYYWGTSELIHYTANGTSLKGALFYPANYQPDKKYPLIAIPYHILSDELRVYTPPSIASSIGINVSHLTQSGYFVLYPDIQYTVNKTGASALTCVNTAVDQAIATASIDPDNVGLFGFSFGGYLVSYIISQTDRYKTAIAGGGFHDLLGTYLGTDDNDKSSMWRFETQQIRITEPFHSKAFSDNSTLNHAHKIETPLLLWIGQNDTRVRGENSSKLQMALWRLGKQSTFLVYPNEPHFILNKDHQIDLTEKTMQWFDHYLKNEAKPQWMN